MMRYRHCCLAGVLFLASALLGHAGGQNPEQATSGLALRADAVEFAVPGYTAGRQGAPATGVRLHDVTFEGQSFPANRLRIQQLSEGVYELTGAADRVGNWRLALKDAADGYYGLGERFNELNHTHQVIRNGSQDNGAAKGSATYKPIPFYMSTTGYGLWVDTTAEAVFDMNATSREDVLITVPAQNLRIVL
jgi:alpha-D-xyloside xylohydrolase